MKFLVCGVGSIGSRHLKNIKALGYTDIILLRTGKSRIPSIDEFAEYPTFFDISEALAQRPDICVVANPTSMHVETALAAAQQGCHLFVEKPLTNCLENLDKLEKVIKKKDLISMVTYQFRYHPHIRLLKDLLGKDKKYGSAVYASAEWSEYLPDWHPWEDYKQSYAASSELGGGVLLTQIHPLNYLNFIFGDIKKTQIQKKSSGSLDISVDDTADILIEFENNIVGHVHVDFIQKPRVHKLKVVTNIGRFEWDCHENSLIFLRMDGTIENFSNSGFTRNDMFRDMMACFIRDVENGKSSGFDISQAISEIKFLLAMKNEK